MTRLDQLSLTAPDSDIVQAIADTLMDVRRLPPYKLAVWHDAKAGPCSLPVHSIIDQGRMCSVELPKRQRRPHLDCQGTRMGYIVARQEGRDWHMHRHSVKEIRRDLDYQSQARGDDAGRATRGRRYRFLFRGKAK